jgi:hypothetical protein
VNKPRLELRPETRALSVETLLQYVRQGKIRVPDFQRALRWRSRNVLDLFDSIYRGFPVGALLLSKHEAKAATLRFGPISVEAAPTREAYFVVDGQQRIIALAGAMLRTDKHPRGDIHAVWFDLEEESFVRAHGSDVPPHWIPLNVAGDSIALLGWLNDWPFRNERRDLVARAIELSKAVREYQIPAYIVETAQEDVPRVIFKRLNNSGVAMQESEVFEALYHAEGPRPLAQACARLEGATGFGAVSADWFLRCLKVVEGLDLRQSFEDLEDDAAAPSAEAVEHTEEALKRAIAFLSEDAGFPHTALLPYSLPLVVLARFFHLHPTPNARTRSLLVRWVWRGALSGVHTNSSDATVHELQRSIGADEFKSVELLLHTVPARVDFPTTATKWYGQAAKSRLCATAMVHMAPRDPETGEPCRLEDVQVLLTRPIGEVFVDVGAGKHSTIARCVLVASREKLRALATSSAEVLESHGIDRKAAEALGRGDLETFERRRQKTLDARFRVFFAERSAPSESDRPPIAELSRRALAKVSQHGRA